MSKNVRRLISPQVLCTSITNRVLSWFGRFTAYYYCMRKKIHKTHISTSFVHKSSKIVLLADLTVLLLITTVWRKMSPNSYLRELCAQVSQIVFIADLTNLRLNTTVWAKMSENSYLREFCAQVSQNVFLVDLTVLRLLIQLYERKCHKVHNSTICVHKYRKSCS